MKVQRVLLCVLVFLLGSLPPLYPQARMQGTTGGNTYNFTNAPDDVTIKEVSNLLELESSLVTQLTNLAAEELKLLTATDSTNIDSAFAGMADVDSTTFYLPAGLYNPGGVPSASEYGQLELNNHCAVLGDGWASSILQNVKSATTVSRLITVYTDTNVVISGIKFVADTTDDYSNEDDHLIVINDSENILIDNCYFYAGSDGIAIQGDCKNITISNCTFIGDSLTNFYSGGVGLGTSASRNGISIVGSITKLTIVDNTFEGFTVACINFEPSTANETMEEVIISNNSFRFTYGAGIGLTNNKADSSCTMKNFSITDCIFDSIKTNSIMLFGAPGLIEGVLIGENVVDNGNYNSGSYPGDIYALQKVRNISISDNIIRNSNGTAIEIQNNSTYASRRTEGILVSNNELEAIDKEGISILGNSTVKIAGVHISDNYIHDAGQDGAPTGDVTAYQGIDVNYVFDLNLSSNTIVNTTGTDSLNIALRVVNSDSVLISGNIMNAAVDARSLSGNTKSFWGLNYVHGVTYNSQYIHPNLRVDANSGWIMIGGTPDTSRYGIKNQQNAWRSFTRRDGVNYIGPKSDNAFLPDSLDEMGIGAQYEGAFYVSYGGDSLLWRLNSAWRTIYPANTLHSDGTEGRVQRNSSLSIENGTTAATIKCTVASLWNGDVIAVTNNIGKGATVGDFTLDASGYNLKIEASGLTGNAVMASGHIGRNQSATAVTCSITDVSNDVDMKFYDAASGVVVDLTTLVDTGTISANILYITSQ